MSVKHFMPSNGTEGMIFMERFCDKCQNDINSDCEYVSMAYMGEQPECWIIQDKKPICTLFKGVK